MLYFLTANLPPSYEDAIKGQPPPDAPYPTPYPPQQYGAPQQYAGPTQPYPQQTYPGYPQGPGMQGYPQEPGMQGYPPGPGMHPPSGYGYNSYPTCTTVAPTTVAPCAYTGAVCIICEHRLNICFTAKLETIDSFPDLTM